MPQGGSFVSVLETVNVSSLYPKAKETSGIKKKNHEFSPLEQNQMLHKRNPSLAGNGNADVEDEEDGSGHCRNQGPLWG